MGLTQKQIEERRLGIGGSDAKMILDGEWLKLWKQKMGIEEPDFSQDQRFRMALGTAVEPVIRDEWKRRHPEFDVRENVLATQEKSDEFYFMRANLDGFVFNKQTKDEAVMEIKFHTGMKSIEELAKFYYGQIQHNIFVADVKKCIFPVGFGAWGKYGELVIERDESFLKDYLELCKGFWFFVENEVEPEDGAGIKIKPKIDDMIIKSYEGNNLWASCAQEWIETKEYKERFDKATKELKSIIEENVKEAYGHGVKIKRAKNGNLSITELTEKDLLRYKKETENE